MEVDFAFKLKSPGRHSPSGAFQSWKTGGENIPGQGIPGNIVFFARRKLHDMTEPIKMEEFSLQLFAMLAAKAGYKTVIPRVDDGTDLMIYPTRQVETFEKAHYAPSSHFIGAQMKTTTQKQTVLQDDNLRYYLRLKNHNDLIAMKNDWYSPHVFGIPFLLLLHVLPDEETEWMEVDFDRQFYKANGLIYWYYPERTDDFSQNPSKVPIFVPVKNRVGLDFFDRAFSSFFH